MYLIYIRRLIEKMMEMIKQLQQQFINLPKPFTFKNSIYTASDFPTLAEVQNGWIYEIKANVIDNNSLKTNTGKYFIKNDEIAWDGISWIILGEDPKDTVSVGNESEFLHAVDYFNQNNGGTIELISSLILGQATIDYQTIRNGIDLSKVIIKSVPSRSNALYFNGVVLKLKGSMMRMDDMILLGTLSYVTQNTQTIIEVSEHLSKIEFNNITFYNILGQNSSVNPIIKINHNNSVADITAISFINCNIYTIGCYTSEHDSFSIQNLCPSLYSLTVKVISQSKTIQNNRASYKVYGNAIQYNPLPQEIRRTFITDTSADLIQVAGSVLQLVYSPIIYMLDIYSFPEKTTLYPNDIVLIADSQDGYKMKKLKESTIGTHTHTPQQIGLGNVTNDLQLKAASNLSDVPDKAIARTNLGIDPVSTKKSNLTATTDPVASNDNTQGYLVGSQWVNTSTARIFFCTNASTGAAVWRRV